MHSREQTNYPYSAFAYLRAGMHTCVLRAQLTPTFFYASSNIPSSSSSRKVIWDGHLRLRNSFVRKKIYIYICMYNPSAIATVLANPNAI